MQKSFDFKKPIQLEEASLFTYEIDKQDYEDIEESQEVVEEKRGTMMSNYTQEMRCLFCEERTIKLYHIQCPYLNKEVCVRLSRENTNIQPH